jgi:hypothetical protein
MAAVDCDSEAMCLLPVPDIPARTKARDTTARESRMWFLPAGARHSCEEGDEAHARGHAFALSETIRKNSSKKSSFEGSACGACELRSHSSECQRASNPQAGHAFCATSARARREEVEVARHWNDPRSVAAIELHAFTAAGALCIPKNLGEFILPEGAPVLPRGAMAGKSCVSSARKQRSEPAQLVLFKQRVGRRRGAGRPPTGKRAGSPHKERPYLHARYPRGIPSISCCG